MHSVLFRSFGRVLMFGLLITSTACDDGPLAPEERVAGRYEATTLVVIEDTGSFDALSAGADIEITLHENGTTTGLFFVPGGDDDGSDFDADLTGTWTVTDDGSRVRLSHAADTFLRDVDLQVRGNTLVSNEGGVQLVLTRQ